eukprot:SAG22_NODE_1427_length_4455_cov_1.597107_1_plen_613_part_10
MLASLFNTPIYRSDEDKKQLDEMKEDLLQTHQLPTLSVDRPELTFRPQPRFMQIITSEQSFVQDEEEDTAAAEAAALAEAASLTAGPEEGWGSEDDGAEDDDDDGGGGGGLPTRGVGKKSLAGGWTSATNHLVIPETPGKSPTAPETPMMQRMALQAQGTYKKGYRPSGEARKMLKLADKHMQEMPPRYTEAAACIEKAQKLDAIYTAKKLGLFREVIETAIGSHNPGQAPGAAGGGENDPSNGGRQYSDSKLAMEMSGELMNTSSFEQSAPFVLDVGEATKNLSEQKPYHCPLLGTPNLKLDTALHLATRYEHTDIVQLLLAFGAPVDLRNKWALTPLHEAARAKLVPSVKLLLQYGADPMLPDLEGNSVLHYCAAYADEAGVELITMLLEAVPSPLSQSVARLRNKQGYNPVHIAKAHGHGQLFRTLMDSLGPEQFFKTKAEQRYCPEVADGAIHRRPISVGIWADPRGPREAWRAELGALQRLKAERGERLAAEAAAAKAAAEAAEAKRVAEEKELAARQGAAKNVRPKIEPLLAQNEMEWDEAYDFILELFDADQIKGAMTEPVALVSHVVAAVGRHRLHVASLASAAFDGRSSSAHGAAELEPEPEEE